MADGFYMGGTRVSAPFDVDAWREHPELAIQRDDYRPRPPGVIDLAVIHTITGEGPQVLLPGRAPSSRRAANVVASWRTRRDKDGELVHAGAHLILTRDARWAQTCDLLDAAAYHAGSKGNGGVNEASIGIELEISGKGELNADQLEELARWCDWVTSLDHPRLCLPRQYLAGPWPVPNVARRFRGIIGHRDVGNRGEFDPGPLPYQPLAARGYEAVDLSGEGDDRYAERWASRQNELNGALRARGEPLIAEDGDPGPQTMRTARRFKRAGQWVGPGTSP